MVTFFCPGCWEEVAEDATRCGFCGADLAALDVEAFGTKLARALWSPEAATARRAAEILGRRCEAGAVLELLRRHRAGADPYLRAEIAKALGLIGGDEANAALLEIARDRSVIVRRAVRDTRRPANHADQGNAEAWRSPSAVGAAHRMPRSIWALGMVSLLMDTSSELVHSLLPVFLVTVLGASAATVGVIEGVGEATASISKLFSGWLSDRLGKRKVLTVAGYGLAALTKPFFALAPTPAWVLGARFADRMGKGIRGAPRDALVGDLTPPELRGAAYGLRQALDSVGAFAGPLLALALMVLFQDDFRRVFLVAVLPALAAVAVLVFAVKEPARGERSVARSTSPAGAGRGTHPARPRRANRHPSAGESCGGCSSPSGWWSASGHCSPWRVSARPS